MIKNIFETIVGAVVLFVAVSFIVTAYKAGNVDTGSKGYTLTAKFDKVDGLSVGSDVKISGIKIGKVKDQTYDQNTYRAVVAFTVDNEVKIPEDSSAEIIGDGLLGSKYLSITPGGADAFLSNNGEIAMTQSSISFEQLIGKFVHGGASSSDDKAASTSSTDGSSASSPSSLFTEPLSSEPETKSVVTPENKEPEVKAEDKPKEEPKSEPKKTDKKQDKQSKLNKKEDKKKG